MEYDPADPTDEAVEAAPGTLELTSIPLPSTGDSKGAKRKIKTNRSSAAVLDDIPLPSGLKTKKNKNGASDIPLPPGTSDHPSYDDNNDTPGVYIPFISNSPQRLQTSPTAPPQPPTPSVPVKFSIKGSGDCSNSGGNISTTNDSVWNNEPTAVKLAPLPKRSKPAVLPTGVIGSRRRFSDTPIAPVGETNLSPSDDNATNVSSFTNATVSNATTTSTTSSSAKQELFLPTETDLQELKKVSHSQPISAATSLLGTKAPDALSTTLSISGPSLLGSAPTNLPVSAITAAILGSGGLGQTAPIPAPHPISMYTPSPGNNLVQLPNPMASLPALANYPTLHVPYLNPQKLRSAQMISQPLIENPAWAAARQQKNKPSSRSPSRSTSTSYSRSRSPSYSKRRRHKRRSSSRSRDRYRSRSRSRSRSPTPKRKRGDSTSRKSDYRSKRHRDSRSRSRDRSRHSRSTAKRDKRQKSTEKELKRGNDKNKSDEKSRGRREEERKPEKSDRSKRDEQSQSKHKDEKDRNTRDVKPSSDKRSKDKRSDDERESKRDEKNRSGSSEKGRRDGKQEKRQSKTEDTSLANNSQRDDSNAKKQPSNRTTASEDAKTQRSDRKEKTSRQKEDKSKSDEKRDTVKRKARDDRTSRSPSPKRISSSRRARSSSRSSHGEKKSSRSHRDKEKSRASKDDVSKSVKGKTVEDESRSTKVTVCIESNYATTTASNQDQVMGQPDDNAAGVSSMASPNHSSNGKSGTHASRIKHGSDVGSSPSHGCNNVECSPTS